MLVKSYICAEIISTSELPGKKAIFIKFYKVCFIECVAPLPASYSEGNKIYLDLNGGKSENIIWKALLYVKIKNKKLRIG